MNKESVSTNFDKRLDWNHEFNFVLWRHKLDTPSNNKAFKQEKTLVITNTIRHWKPNNFFKEIQSEPVWHVQLVMWKQFNK